MTLGEEVLDYFVVEKDTNPSSCVTINFTEKFELSSTVIMDTVKEHILLVGGSEKSYDNTSWWVSEELTGVQKREASSIYLDALFGILGHLVGFYVDLFALACKYFRRKLTWWNVCLVEIFYHTNSQIRMYWLTL